MEKIRVSTKAGNNLCLRVRARVTNSARIFSNVSVTTFLIASFLFFNFSLSGSEQKPADTTKLVKGSIEKNGIVNWTDGYIEAAGEGASASWESVGLGGRGVFQPADRRLFSARDKAANDARKKLAELVNTIYIDSAFSVGGQSAVNELIAKQVNRYLRGGFVSEDFRKREATSDGIIKTGVRVRLPLYGRGSLADIVQPGSFGSDVQRSQPEPMKPERTESFSGLVIDTRGLKINPALFPRILNANGTELYSDSFVSREYSVKKGLVGYSHEFESARKMASASGNPLVIKPLMIAGVNKTDVVISRSGALKVEQVKQDPLFLKQSRVVFLVD